MGLEEMDLSEFWEKGYLQEVNRRFFHPLGLAMGVEFEVGANVETDKPKALILYDYRDFDPEGVAFFDGPDQEKADFVENEMEDRLELRRKLFLNPSGIQPCGYGMDYFEGEKE